jgi:peptidyl-prolyl cis-trans isomerase SurA
MSRRCWLATVGAALALIACGCLTRTSSLADSPPSPDPLALAGPDVTRAQNPETPNPPNNAVCRLLTLPVDRPAEAAHASPAATIRAVVNGELILEEEVLMSCMAQLHAAHTPEEHKQIIKQAVENLIDREVILLNAISKLKHGGKQGEAFLVQIQKMTDEEFEKRYVQPMLKAHNFTSRKEFADYLKKNGMSFEVIRRSWERKWMCDGILMSQIQPRLDNIGHTEISEYYNSHRDEFTQPDRVDWQDIFLDSGRYASRDAARQFAEALVQRARQGEDFVKLCVEFDNGESGRFRKGAGEGHKRGEIFPREAEPLLFAMHEGDTEILECAHGFHIIHLVKRQFAGPIPFDANVQKEIRNKLRELVFQREKEGILKKLKQKAVIDRCD